jgi:hypothetical protein
MYPCHPGGFCAGWKPGTQQLAVRLNLGHYPPEGIFDDPHLPQINTANFVWPLTEVRIKVK